MSGPAGSSAGSTACALKFRGIKGLLSHAHRRYKHIMRLGLFVFVLSLVWLPYRVIAGEVTVGLENLEHNTIGLQRATGLQIPPPDPSLPLVAATSNTQVATLLRRYDVRGVLNGFDGILYDNRDRDHSRLNPSEFPRLHHLRYSDDLKEANADYGPAGTILFPAVVFGNSSTALTDGADARSLPRFTMTTPDGPDTTAMLYFNNHIYVYPEHRDYDRADRYPAYWPYQVISQGSSGSDQPFLRAMAATLAAFPADTLDYMRDAGLVAPTLQMILRRNLRTVNGMEQYLTGKGHQPVLTASELRPARMVAHAAALRPEAVPPIARISVLEEDFRDTAGLAQLSEKLYDTPAAIARVWRGFEGQKTLTLSAQDTVDPQGRPMTYTWRLLQGDPDRVRITPIANGQQARIMIVWHDPYEIAVPDRDRTRRIETSRVDVGLFASTGREQSAPAVLSVLFPAHQKRTYGRSNTGGLRLAKVDYDAMGRGAYFDPRLYWSAAWTDTAVYNTRGSLTAWERRFSDENRAVSQIPADGPPTGHTLRSNNGQGVLRYTQ